MIDIQRRIERQGRFNMFFYTLALVAIGLLFLLSQSQDATSQSIIEPFQNRTHEQQLEAVFAQVLFSNANDICTQWSHRKLIPEAGIQECSTTLFAGVCEIYFPEGHSECRVVRPTPEPTPSRS